MRSRGGARLILIPLLLLLAAGGAAYYFLYHKHSHKAAPIEETYEMTLADLIVNLADEKKPHYLSASITIILKGVKPQPAVEEREAEIRDAVIMVTTQHSYSDLLTAEGKETLKNDIAAAVEDTISEARLAVIDVLFTSFLMD